MMRLPPHGDALRIAMSDTLVRCGSLANHECSRAVRVFDVF
jgi:hypothetical protein